MRSKTILTMIVAGICGALLTTAQAQEGDIEAGKYAFSTCSGCHAIAGYSNVYPTYHVPRLGGQDAAYVVAALQAYKNHERDHATMQANAANLSEQDMADIGAYLASIKPGDELGPVSGNAEEGKQKTAACAACHGEDGNGVPGMQPPPARLAGQFQDYLIHALQSYRLGATSGGQKGRNNATMSAMAAALSDEDIVNIAAYYASQTPALAVIEYSGQAD